MNLKMIGSRVYLITSKGVSITNGQDTFNKLASLIREDRPEEEVIAALNMSLDDTVSNKVEVLTSYGIKFEEGVFYWGTDISLPVFMVDYIENLGKNNSNIESIYKFWMWSQLNPNPASRYMLFEHCMKYKINITPSGMLVLYRNVVPVDMKGADILSIARDKYTKLISKGKNPKKYFLNEDNKFKKKGSGSNLYDLIHYPHRYFDNKFTDAHTRTMDYRVNLVASIPREECDETQATCSLGLHLASKEWLSDNYFGSIGLVCLVNPMNVVSAPSADGYGKIRCCEFLPIGYFDYVDGRISDVDLDLQGYNYSDETLETIAEMVNEIDILETNSNNSYTVPNLFKRFKAIVNLEDIKLQEIVEEEGSIGDDNSFYGY